LRSLHRALPARIRFARQPLARPCPPLRFDAVLLDAVEEQLARDEARDGAADEVEPLEEEDEGEEGGEDFEGGGVEGRRELDEGGGVAPDRVGR
jgi:hypothetical protein